MKPYHPPLILLLVAIWLWVSEQDYQDALADEAHYQDMVATGVWPAYRGE